LPHIINSDKKPDIRSLSIDAIEQVLIRHDAKRFRIKQILEWLWKNGAGSFDEMANIPVLTRLFLKDHFTFHTAIPEIKQRSSDGTVKVGFRLFDRSMIEGVLIPAGNRYTACISSQVGCNLGCRFCATGKQGFTRNLSRGEIFDQVIHLSRLAGAEPFVSTVIHSKSEEHQHPSPGVRNFLSNIVYMGMGEPFLNYKQVNESIEKITAADGLGISPQRITVSSIGIPKMIHKMADDGAKYHFALSLHAATDNKRNQVIPFNQRHPLSEITEALKYYHSKTQKRVTIEYILFAGFNDSTHDARDLAHFCRNFPVKINLIEYNPVKETGFTGSGTLKIQAFTQSLEKCNLVVNIRKSRGKDIDAACGQLSAVNSFIPEESET